MNIGPGQRYGSVRNGAKATAKLLREPLYDEILASAYESDRPLDHGDRRLPIASGGAGYERLLRRAYGSFDVK